MTSTEEDLMALVFAYEATHQLMAVLVTEIVYLRRRQVRACTGGNQRDTRVSEEPI